ncbi:MAG: alpha/beta fold hydrolase [Meiothermus sp.]|nr:alpha/beta fold hydrolase [Meiothermus sp.]
MNPWMIALAGVWMTGLAAATGQEVALETPTATLYGTLELPAGSGPFVVALIHPGSGPTDRDGNTRGLPGKNDSLKLLAEGLAAQGVASLRVDKRAVGKSVQPGLKEEEVTLDTFAADALAWIAFLRKDRRFSRVAFIGHSEGALIGLLASSQADGYVSLAGAGRPLDVVLTEQLEANPANPPALIEESKKIMAELKAGRTVAQVSPVLAPLFRPSVQPFLISSFRRDPARLMAGLQTPALIVQGTTDIQVAVKDAQALAAANPRARLVLLEGMNHVLKAAPAERNANLATYFNPSLPLANSLVENIAQFLKGL